MTLRHNSFTTLFLYAQACMCGCGTGAAVRQQWPWGTTASSDFEFMHKLACVDVVQDLL